MVCESKRIIVGSENLPKMNSIKAHSDIARSENNTSRKTAPISEQKNQNADSFLDSQTQKWVTIVHNDPVNLMAYVQWIFETYFKMDSNIARMKMLHIHQNGRAVVASGRREEMERDVQAMHIYGLWATIEPAGDC